MALRNPFYSVLALVCHLLSLAALFLLLRAEFLAAAQVIVYVGAVMVLYLFVVAYVGGGDDPIRARRHARPALGERAVRRRAVRRALDRRARHRPDRARRGGRGWFAGFGTPAEIGRLLLTDFLLAFEVASILLLVAAVGAVILARRRTGLEDPREISVGDLHAHRQPRRADRRRGGHDDRGRRPAAAMSIEWYLVVSALVFCIGAGGILVRRNPLVILLCLELMLNAGNLALVAFARAHGNQDGPDLRADRDGRRRL